MTPEDRVAQLDSQALGTHFSHLLQHAWVTVGLLFNPGHHTGKQITLLLSFTDKYFKTHSVPVTSLQTKENIKLRKNIFVLH
jgi:hypothetical protein